MHGFGYKVHIALAALFIIAPAAIYAQAPYPPQAPVAPPMPGAQQQYAPQRQPQRQPQQPPRRQQTQPPAQDQRNEYAYRPDLTNPEFGECLNLEKNWQGLWQRYAEMYEGARWMNPQDPQYAQTAWYLQHLKGQLDAAWYTFSSKCIYFPQRRR